MGAEAELVVLLHGLGRTARSMRRLESGARRSGYATLNLGYPASRRPLEQLADRLERRVEPLAAARRVHFVTHSYGGIVVRCLLRRPRKLDLGRVVMLGPPNGGSELIDAIGRVPLLRRLAGRTRMQLGTGADGVPAGLGPVDFELGVIAGTRRLNLPLALLIPGPNDGIVAVARTRVDGMSDFLEVPHTHTFMMRSREVIRQTLLFLERGRFDHGTASLSP